MTLLRKWSVGELKENISDLAEKNVQLEEKCCQLQGSLKEVMSVGDTWHMCTAYCNPLLFRCRFNFGNFGTSIFYLN